MNRTIKIVPILNGFVCEVGCQKVCFTNRVSLLDALELYLKNPNEEERKFREEAVNPDIEGLTPCPTDGCSTTSSPLNPVVPAR